VSASAELIDWVSGTGRSSSVCVSCSVVYGPGTDSAVRWMCRFGRKMAWPLHISLTKSVFVVTFLSLTAGEGGGRRGRGGAQDGASCALAALPAVGAHSRSTYLKGTYTVHCTTSMINNMQTPKLQIVIIMN